MIHNVFAGNPGSGKSTIANTLIGSPVFEAGISFGCGLTTALATHEHNGQKYSDTPGLDDIDVREQAASEISKALTHADHLRLIFVCTLEDGRVRPADVVTIEIILDAIAEVGVFVDGMFSLIVNKCNDAELEAIESNERDRKMVSETFANGKMLQHVYFAPRCPEAEGKPDALLPMLDQLRLFVDTAPVMRMPGRIITIDLAYYQERISALVAEIARLKRLWWTARSAADASMSDQEDTFEASSFWSQAGRGAAMLFVVGLAKRALPIFLRSFV